MCGDAVNLWQLCTVSPFFLDRLVSCKTYLYILLCKVDILRVCVLYQFLSSLHIMDYSLIVGIHDATREDMQQRNSFPVPADEEDDEEEEGPYEEQSEEVVEEEENGLGGEEECGDVGVPTPPDSPQPTTPMVPFCGELDGELERFAVRSTEGEMNCCYLINKQFITKYLKLLRIETIKLIVHSAISGVGYSA